MTISKETIEVRKQSLAQDFSTLKGRIDTAEKEIVGMRNNLNAVAGAIQQCDMFLKDMEAGGLVAENEQDYEKLQKLEKEKTNSKGKAVKADMPASKQQALNIATT